MVLVTIEALGRLTVLWISNVCTCGRGRLLRAWLWKTLVLVVGLVYGFVSNLVRAWVVLGRAFMISG